jgi:hypothetical protein
MKAVNAGFTLFRDAGRRKRGYSRAMTTRHDIRALGRAASQAGPKGSALSTLILGSLLLLISP